MYEINVSGLEVVQTFPAVTNRSVQCVSQTVCEVSICGLQVSNVLSCHRQRYQMCEVDICGLEVVPTFSTVTNRAVQWVRLTVMCWV